MAAKKKAMKTPDIHGKTKVFGDPVQIAAVKAEIEDMTRMLRSDDEKTSSIGYLAHSSKYLNVEEVTRTLNQRKKFLKEISPPAKIKGAQVNKAYSEAKKLREWIIKNVPRETFAMYPRAKDPVGKTYDFEKLVEKQAWWNLHGTKAIDRYNYLMQRIEPGRPREGFDNFTHERA